MATPLDVVHLGRVGSTQDEAAERFRGSPLLVTATEQSKGRGRGGAEWLNADRALAASLAIRPDWDPSRLSLVTLVAGLAVLDVLPSRVSLDWPNDVVIGDDKVGGILTESSEGLVRIGLGLNVAWQQPPDGMAALHRRDPGAEHVRTVAERWAGAAIERIGRGPDAWGRDEYSERCRTLGREVSWEPDGHGVAVAVGDDGALLVQAGDGPRTLRAGEVRRIRAG